MRDYLLFSRRKNAQTVILVDDSKTILATAEMAMESLEASGKVNMKTYLNPAALLEALENGSEDYDMLISDINMPQLNGLDLAHILKQNPNFKQKPILILTTESSTEMKAKGKAIGVTGWLVKPFSNEKLTKAVSMVLGL